MSADVATIWEALDYHVHNGYRDDDGVWHETGRKAELRAALDRLAALVAAAGEVNRQLKATRYAGSFYVSDRALDALDAALVAVAPPLDHSGATDVDSRA